MRSILLEKAFPANTLTTYYVTFLHPFDLFPSSWIRHPWGQEFLVKNPI